MKKIIGLSLIAFAIIVFAQPGPPPSSGSGGGGSGGGTVSNSSALTSGQFVKGLGNGLVGPTLDASALTNYAASNVVSGGTIPSAAVPNLSATYEAHVATLTNSLYASNLVSGGQIPVGTLFDITTNESGGWLLISSGSPASRHRSWNADTLTNMNASELRSGTVDPARLAATVNTNNGTLSGLLKGDGGRGTTAAAFSDVQALAPLILTNKNVNSFVIFTNNGVSLAVDSSGNLTLTNYAAAGMGFVWSTNSGNYTNTGNIQAATINTTGAAAIGGNLSLSSSGSINVVGGTKGISLATSVGNMAVQIAGSGTYYLGMGPAVDKDFGALGFNATGLGVTAMTPVLLWGTNKMVIVTNATAASSYGDITARLFITPTNYVAANFTPVPGCVFQAVSNGVYYKVSQVSTTLWSSATP